MQEDLTAYSFKMLIKNKKEDYMKKTTFEDKEKIISKFICEPDISFDFLQMLKNNYELTKESKYFDTFEYYFNNLEYSLPKEQNFLFYEFLTKTKPKDKYKFDSYKFLAFNDPIDNFKKINLKYSAFVDEIEDLEKTKKNLAEIDKFIDEMLLVYNINLTDYYFPPMEEYPVYVYNFYSFLLFKLLKKFENKRNLFENKNNQTISYTPEEKIEINYQIGKFFDDIKILFEKFKYQNIKKDLKILKIIVFYFKIFEISRDYKKIRDIFLKVIDCINSTPITSDILQRLQFFRKNSNTSIKKEEWDSIGLNEILYINYPMKISVKIKYFRNNILQLNNDQLLFALSKYSIENLNFDGLIQNSIVKYTREIENYSKKLLKQILSSEKYITNFLKYDSRFNSQIDRKKLLLDSIFNGTNSELIFEEIWENIIFIPFPESNFSGYNYRNQYSIFINSQADIEYNTTFQKIIPLYHCQINNLYHEYTHNIILILAANLEQDNFETETLSNNKELKDLQTYYSSLYNQGNMLYDEFDDFGDLMEVILYGIRPKKYKTFSGLFFLDYNSYELELNLFRETCVKLYNYEIKDNTDGYSENEEEQILKKLLDFLMKSTISKLLLEYFPLDTINKNEVFTEDGKPRVNYSYNIHNEEYSVDIDYCDKLD